jgi:hypothetical protein
MPRKGHVNPSDSLPMSWTIIKVTITAIYVQAVQCGWVSEACKKRPHSPALTQFYRRISVPKMLR